MMTAYVVKMTVRELRAWTDFMLSYYDDDMLMVDAMTTWKEWLN